LDTLQNKLTQVISEDGNLASQIQLYSNYVDYDISRKCFVLTSSSDVVICNEEYLEDYISAGFQIFGESDIPEVLADIIYRAERS